MGKAFKLSAIVAILATFILVMIGCDSPAPTPTIREEVVDLSGIPVLYEKGPEMHMLTCSTTTYQWKDCDGVLHPGTKLAEDRPLSFVSQGKPLNLTDKLGVTEGKELVLRDKQAPAPKAKVPEKAPETVEAKQKKSSEKSASSDWNDIPWYVLGYVLVGGLTALLLFLFGGLLLLRRLILWMFEPLSSQTNTTHTTTSRENGNPCPPSAPAGNTAVANPNGSVVVNPAGRMIRRTTTVVEEFAAPPAN